ncbi:MAG: response regulator, partial [Candidatus Melainabacteria bacterium]|nr:response regulator [Candidatus Melainabacteria bacterium]
YLVTRKDDRLADFRKSMASIIVSCDEIRNLTSDNAKQTARILECQSLIDSRFNEWNQLISENAVPGTSQWKAVLEKSFESAYAADIKKLVEVMKEDEQSLLKVRTKSALESVETSQQASFILTALLVGVLGGISAIVILSMNRAISSLLEGIEDIGNGNYKHRIKSTSKDELGSVARSFDRMAVRVDDLSTAQEQAGWIKRNINDFAFALQGQRDYKKAGAIILSKLAPLVEARQAALYRSNVAETNDTLVLAATFACETDSALPQSIKFGEGTVGQCAFDKNPVRLESVKAENFKIKSALADSAAFDVVVFPLVFEGETRGVMELASEKRFSDASVKFIEELCHLLGVVLAAIESTQTTERLLEESIKLNEELRLQQEELEAQAEELETQQEELRQANEEMQQRQDALEEQNALIFEKNIELEGMRQSLEDKAHQLAVSSKYKSEFLANMSHDLRTPLNSLLIFSELLGDNEEGNLTETQVDFAKNINLAGKTLLTLIDDILDLSKIEAGRITPDIKNIELADVIMDLQRSFGKVAEGKKIHFDIDFGPDTPRMIRSDERRLMQLLNNLLSNAFKFTEKGSVKLSIAASKPEEGHGHDGAGDLVKFAITDTGIGIAPEQQALVFEAFHQADSSSTRKFGGTGLGLSICRELSALLGGWVDVKSELGKGSTFTLNLPQVYKGNVAPKRRVIAPPSDAPAVESIQGEKDNNAFLHSDVPDDRLNINEGDRVMLIIEDDKPFATMLLDLARKNKFKGVVTLKGRDGLILARRLLPDAVTLDLRLPDIEGWVVLDQLKNMPETRHIPVHIISATSEQHRGLSLGAIGYLEKPITLDTLNLAIEKIGEHLQKRDGAILIADSDAALRTSLVELLENGDCTIDAVQDGDTALKFWSEKEYDCSIINMHLNDMDGLSLARKFLSTNYTHPLLVFSNQGLSEDEKAELDALGRLSIVKDISSPELLLSEVGLFLHRVESKLPAAKQKLITKVRQEDNTLVGRKMMIVDDDPRNVQALATLLKKYQMNLVTAENGREALDKLDQNKDMDIILMDIMMPEMDGYDAMRAIRAQKEFATLPIIAVTAKAMQGDRIKCLDSGASDYITKPVDRNQLLSLLRVWLYRP